MRIPFFLLLVTACGASAPAPAGPPGARGPRADEHLDAAQAHAHRAAALAGWLDARGAPKSGSRDSEGLWYRALELSRDDERRTAEHRRAAADLAAAHELACRGIAAEDAAESPLRDHLVGWFRTADGITVLLSPNAGPAERLTQRLRCHRAWLMLETSPLANSLLDIDGLDVLAYGDRTGISVELSVAEPSLTAELQRRAARDLAEATARR